jgi:hypothetical protein
MNEQERQLAESDISKTVALAKFTSLIITGAAKFAWDLFTIFAVFQILSGHWKLVAQ